MTFLELHSSTALSILIIIMGGIISGFLLIFGIVDLIYPDGTDAYLAQNTKICLVVCGIGVIFQLLMIAVFSRILLKKRYDAVKHKT